VGDVAQRYYSPLVGAWSGRFEFVVTDSRALGQMGMARWLPLRLFAVLAWYGTRMSTTLSQGEDARTFLHTTRVSLFGVPIYSTRESIVIGEDGRAFSMTGSQRQTLGKDEAYEAQGEVLSDASGATYRLKFFGGDLVQRTRLVPEGLSLSQESPWTRGSVVLERV
jgi:hypothetical protein